MAHSDYMYLLALNRSAILMIMDARHQTQSLGEEFQTYHAYTGDATGLAHSDLPRASLWSEFMNCVYTVNS